MKKRIVSLLLVALLALQLISMTTAVGAIDAAEKFNLTFQLMDGKESYHAGETVTAGVYLAHAGGADIGSFETTLTYDVGRLTLTGMDSEEETVITNPANGKMLLLDKEEGFHITAEGTRLATATFIVKTGFVEATSTDIGFCDSLVSAVDGTKIENAFVETPCTVNLAVQPITGHKISGHISVTDEKECITTVKLYDAADVTDTNRVDASVEVIASTTADVTNAFAFENVADGTYTVVASRQGSTDAFAFHVVVNGADVTITPVLCLYAGDLNGDNSVTVEDQAEIAKNLLKITEEYDLDGDGVVTAADDAVIIDSYLKNAFEVFC